MRTLLIGAGCLLTCLAFIWLTGHQISSLGAPDRPPAPAPAATPAATRAAIDLQLRRALTLAAPAGADTAAAAAAIRAGIPGLTVTDATSAGIGQLGIARRAGRLVVCLATDQVAVCASGRPKAPRTGSGPDIAAAIAALA